MDHFYNHAKSKDGKAWSCKSCSNKRSAEYAKQHRDQIKAKRYSYKTRYGISGQAYDALLKTQDGKCAICKTETCSTGRKFAVDHNHNTGQVRGLLCSSCNTGIGQFKDSAELIGKAIDYLERSRT